MMYNHSPMYKQHTWDGKAQETIKVYTKRFR
jgi:hypothetical protein